MAARRHSRTPQVLTKDQQEALVKAADTDSAMRERLEAALGVVWSNLNFGQRLQALREMQETGYSAGSIAGALRGIRDLDREVELKTHGMSIEDRVLVAEERIRVLEAEVAERDQTIKGLMSGRRAGAQS